MTHQFRTEGHKQLTSAYPPIGMFEDIADPMDWELLAAAKEKTNPRLSQETGNLNMIPAERRVGGPGAAYVIAPFAHASTHRPGRFHDGVFGAFCGAENFETALLETIHHESQRFAAANEEPPHSVERTPHYKDITDKSETG